VKITHCQYLAWQGTSRDPGFAPNRVLVWPGTCQDLELAVLVCALATHCQATGITVRPAQSKEKKRGVQRIRIHLDPIGHMAVGCFFVDALFLCPCFPALPSRCFWVKLLLATDYPMLEGVLLCSSAWCAPRCARMGPWCNISSSIC